MNIPGTLEQSHLMSCLADRLCRGTGLPTRDFASHGSGDPCHLPTKAKQASRYRTQSE